MSLRFKSLNEARKVLGDAALKSELSKKAKAIPGSRQRRLANGVEAPRIPEDEMSPPQRKLWLAVADRFFELEPRSEFEGSVPGRDFRLDIAFPQKRLAIEVDGWQYHGKYKSGFMKDREKQNLLVLNGWRVLRFSAGLIFKDIETVLSQISDALRA